MRDGATIPINRVWSTNEAEIRLCCLLYYQVGQSAASSLLGSTWPGPLPGFSLRRSCLFHHQLRFMRDPKFRGGWSYDFFLYRKGYIASPRRLPPMWGHLPFWVKAQSGWGLWRHRAQTHSQGVQDAPGLSLLCNTRRSHRRFSERVQRYPATKLYQMEENGVERCGYSYKSIIIVLDLIIFYHCIFISILTSEAFS